MSERTLSRVHGGLSPTDDLGHRSVLDFSTCVDAFGTLAPIERALLQVDATRRYRSYPDADSRLARGRLAEFAGAPIECVDVGPGAAELLWTLTRTLLRPDDLALAWKPCFSEFEHAVAAVGARLHAHWFGSEPMEREVARFFDAVTKLRPRVVYLCAPTCPRGQWVPIELLRAGARGAADTTFVIDQSYLSLSAHAGELGARLSDNVVFLRSLTKELGAPGVRVGYTVSSAALRARVQAQRAFWAVGAHAQALLEVYVECLPLLAERRQLLLERASELCAALGFIGLNPELNDTHYFTIDVSGAPLGDCATTARAKLLREGIAVRDCSSFGLPQRVRVVAHPEQRSLIEACTRVLAGHATGGGS